MSAAVLATVGSAVGAFVGVLIAQWVTRKGAKELETRSRREEVMRNLRWAAELTVVTDQARADLGVAQLQALRDSNLSDADVQAFVDAAVEVVVEPVADAVEQHPDAEISPMPESGGTSQIDGHNAAGSVDSSPTSGDGGKGDG